MTDLPTLLQEFYRDKLAMLLRHQVGARLIRQYDVNNTYQYIVNRDDAQLSWVAKAIEDLGGTIPTAAETDRGLQGKGPEVEIAYELAPRAWGRGYATEAARALVEYGLRELGLARIVALILPDNVRSRHVAEKAAMRLAGPARHYGLDLLKYAIGADSGPTLAT